MARMTWSQLSEFRLCEDHESNPERLFVLHTRSPRFLVEIVDGRAVGKIYPIDEASKEELERLATRACEFVGGDRC